MDGPSEDFLPGARFSPDKHRRIAGGYPRKLTELGKKDGTFADDLPETDTRLDFFNLGVLAKPGAR
jgi:hypothetical protein